MLDTPIILSMSIINPAITPSKIMAKEKIDLIEKILEFISQFNFTFKNFFD